MSFDLCAEVDRAKFLDWVENNKDKLIEHLILEHEDVLIEIYDWAKREDLK